MSEPRKTPLYDRHAELGAKIVDFAGWWLPVHYAGILEEHRAVRQQAGLFDVSHMGEIRVRGRGAFGLLQKILTNTVENLNDGAARYSPLCYSSGGVVDDVLIYRLKAEDYLLVVNAANKDKDLHWIEENAAGFDAAVQDESDATAQIALQGPASSVILAAIAGDAVTRLGYYEFLPEVNLAGRAVLVSRTGYTGEDGFEIYCRSDAAVTIWDVLLAAGKKYGLQPAGLGCRDTLRFEAAMPLYGHELSADISPLEAGLSRFVAFDKGGFIGRESLLQQKEQGVRRKLVGLEMLERGVARSGYAVFKANQNIGVVTSGTVAPTLGKNLGMALISAEAGSVGTEIEVEIREKLLKAQIVARPFYKRGN